MWIIPTILVFLALATLILIGAILWTKFLLRPPGPPVIEPLDADAPLGTEVAAALDELEVALAGRGFERLGRVRASADAAVGAYAAALVSDDGLVIGQGVVYALRLGERERCVSRCVELSTRLEGGPVLITSNAAGHVLMDRLVSYWRFPLCRDAGALVRIHRAILAADARSPVPLEPGASAWLARLGEDGRQTWRALADAGLVAQRGGECRYTWRFALTTVLGGLWPFSALRERRARREAREVLDTVWLGALWKTG